MLKGDTITDHEIGKAIKERANQIYETDGGRDLPHHQHPRTRAQREYDAAYELICGVTTTPTGTTTPNIPSNTTSSSARPRIVITVDIDKLIGQDPAKVAQQIGLGAIPDTVLANYAQHADIFAALFDRNGEPLWLARLHRYATPTQFIALVLRDKACVLCSAHYTQCDAHHSMPANAPGQGHTDLDNLVLLCKPCHTRLHADHKTIYPHPHTGHWKTRPATPDEIAPTRPTNTQRPPPQE